jgi:hypothetical protein
MLRRHQQHARFLQALSQGNSGSPPSEFALHNPFFPQKTNEASFFYRYPFEGFGPGSGGPINLKLRLGGTDSESSEAVRALSFRGNPAVLLTPPAHLTEDAVAAAMLERVRAVQYPTDCSTVRFAVRKLDVTGMGSVVLATLGEFATCTLGLGVLLVPGSGWGYEKECRASTGWECIFQQPTHCVLPPSLDISVGGGVPLPNSSEELLLWRRRLLTPSLQVGDCLSERGSNWEWRDGVAFLARKYAAKENRTAFNVSNLHDGFLFAHLATLLLRPQLTLQRDAERLMGALPFLKASGNRCVAVHVRQGDKGTRGMGINMPRFQLSDILPLLRRLVHASSGDGFAAAGPTPIDILFQSDGTALLEDAMSYVHGHADNFVLRTLNFSLARPIDGADGFREDYVGATKGLRPEDSRLLVVADLLALSRCRLFVGTLSSAFTKTLFLLSIGSGAVKWPERPVQGSMLPGLTLE